MLLCLERKTIAESHNKEEEMLKRKKKAQCTFHYRESANKVGWLIAKGGRVVIVSVLLKENNHLTLLDNCFIGSRHINTEHTFPPRAIALPVSSQ